MLIVKSETGGLEAAEQFLRNRGWQVFSTTNPSEAITLLAQHQPRFVLISVNNISKKIQNLSSTIRDTFQCSIIMFAELSDVSSFRMLQDAKSTLVIYPPLTGPAVERAVNKIRTGYVASADLKSSGAVIVASRPAVITKLEKIDDSVVMTKNFQESVVFHATRDALLKTAASGTHKTATSSIYSDAVACLAIQGSACSGYLVIASSGADKLDDGFLRQLKIYLLSALAKRDEDIFTEKDMQLTLKHVPFEKWAIKNADFLRKSVHSTGEVALAFFSSPTVLTNFEASERSNMCAMSLLYIQPNEAVKCNLYLHLPNNERYILYTPSGSKIYSKQLEKLQQQGVTQMHILIEDTHKFNIYRAEGFLNSSIENFAHGESLTP